MAAVRAPRGIPRGRFVWRWSRGALPQEDVRWGRPACEHLAASATSPLVRGTACSRDPNQPGSAREGNPCSRRASTTARKPRNVAISGRGSSGPRGPRVPGAGAAPGTLPDPPPPPRTDARPVRRGSFGSAAVGPLAPPRGVTRGRGTHPRRSAGPAPDGSPASAGTPTFRAPRRRTQRAERGPGCPPRTPAARGGPAATKDSPLSRAAGSRGGRAPAPAPGTRPRPPDRSSRAQDPRAPLPSACTARPTRRGS